MRPTQTNIKVLSIFQLKLSECHQFWMALLDSSFTFFTTEYEITLVGRNQATVLPHYYHHELTSTIDIM
jgi:hypothetical protein